MEEDNGSDNDLLNIIQNKKTSTSSKRYQRRRRKKRSKEHTQILFGFERCKKRRKTTQVNRASLERGLVRAPLTPMPRSSSGNLNDSPMNSKEKLTKLNYLQSFSKKKSLKDKIHLNKKSYLFESISEAPSVLERSIARNSEDGDITPLHKFEPDKNSSPFKKNTNFPKKPSSFKKGNQKKSRNTMIDKRIKKNPQDMKKYKSLKRKEHEMNDEDSKTEKIEFVPEGENGEFDSNAEMLASERPGIHTIPGEFESKHIKTLTNLKHQSDTRMNYSFNNRKKADGGSLNSKLISFSDKL